MPLSRRTMFKVAGMSSLSGLLALEGTRADAAPSPAPGPTLTGTRSPSVITLKLSSRPVTAVDVGSRFAISFDATGATMNASMVVACERSDGTLTPVPTRIRTSQGRGPIGTITAAMVGARLVCTATAKPAMGGAATIVAKTMIATQSQSAAATFRETSTGVALNDGISFTGLEWSSDSAAHMPGMPGVDYWGMEDTDVALLAAHGVRHVRLPFRFERWETAAGRKAILDSVARLRAAGITCTLDAHHQATRWNSTFTAQLLLDSGWSIDQLVGSWLSVANHPALRNDPGISFDLMNEPRNLMDRVDVGNSPLAITPNFQGWTSEQEKHTLLTPMNDRMLVKATGTATGNYPMYLSNQQIITTLSNTHGNGLVATVKMTQHAGSKATVTAQLKAISRDWQKEWTSPVVLPLRQGEAVDVVLPLTGDAWKAPTLRLEVQVWNGATPPVIEVSNLRQTKSPVVRTGAQRLEDAYSAVISSLRSAGVTNLLKVQLDYLDPVFNIQARHPRWWIDDPFTILSLHLYLDEHNTGMYAGLTAWADNEAAIAAAGRWTGGLDRVNDCFDQLQAWLRQNPHVAGVELGEIGWPNRAGFPDKAQWNALGQAARTRLAALPVPTAATYWCCGPWADGLTDGRTTAYPARGGKLGGAGVVGSQNEVLQAWYARSTSLTS